MLHQASVPAAGGTKIRIWCNDKSFDYTVPDGMDRVNIGIEAATLTTEMTPEGEPNKTEDIKPDGSHGLSPEAARVHNAATAGLKDAKDSKPAPSSTGGGSVSTTGKSATTKTTEPRISRAHA